MDQSTTRDGPALLALRQSEFAAMAVAGLPVADIVIALYPDGSKSCIWGRETLLAVALSGRPHTVLRADITCADPAEAQHWHLRYWAACDPGHGRA